MNQSLVPKSDTVAEDEIDLMELFGIVWRGRVQLIVVVLLSLLLASLYLWWQAPQYRVEAQVSHPNSLELAELVVLTLEPNEDDLSASTKALYSPKEVFVTAQREIVSRATQREFVLSVNKQLSNDSEPLDFSWFVNSLKVVAQKEDKAATGIYLVSIECGDELWCSGLVNDYVDFVHEKVRESLVTDMLALLESEATRLSDSMRYLRKNHKQVIQDRLVVLDVQIGIAKEMGWAAPKMEILASDKRMARYYEGYKLLESQRKQLLLQLDSEPHIAGLRGQQRRLERIELDKARITTVSDDVSVLNVVDYAYPTGIPVSPNKKLVVIMAFLLGGFLGLVLVFVVHGVRVCQLRAKELSEGLSIN